jgi:hypothetical protein
LFTFPAGSGFRAFPLQRARPTLSCLRRPLSIALAGPDRLNRRVHHLPDGPDRPIVRPPLLRFSLPFSVCRSCCAIRGGQPSDHPASTLRCGLPVSAGGRTHWTQRRPCGFSALRSPCVRPTPPDCNSRFTPVRFGLFAAVSLCARRSATRETKPCHDWAGSALCA